MAEQTSIWKKELKLRKRSPKPAPESTGTELHGGSSIWKKELRFKRSNPASGQTEAAADLLVDEPVLANEPDLPAVDDHVDESEQLVLEDPPSPPPLWRRDDGAGIAESFEAPAPTEETEEIDLRVEDLHAGSSAPAPTWSLGYGSAETRDEHAGPDAAYAEYGGEAESFESAAPAMSTGAEQQYAEPFASFAEEGQIAEQASDEYEAATGYGWPLDEQEASAEPASEPEIPTWPAAWAAEAAEAAQPEPGWPAERTDVELEDASQEDIVGAAAWPAAADNQLESEPPFPTWHRGSSDESSLDESPLPAAGSGAEHEVEAIPAVDEHYDPYLSGLPGQEVTAVEQDAVAGYSSPLEQDEADSGPELDAEPAEEPRWTLASSEPEQAGAEAYIEQEAVAQENTIGAAAWVAAGEQLEPEVHTAAPHEDSSDDSDLSEALPIAAAFAAAQEVETAPVELPVEADAEPETIEALEPDTAATLEPATLTDETAPAAAPAALVEQKGKSSKKKSSTQIVGVRIGSSQIVVSVVRNAHGVAELAQLASAPVDRGVVVAGEVREPDALAAQLKSVFAKHKLPRKGIRLGIASNRVGVRTLEVPAIGDQKALENAIRFRAQDVLSIPLSDVILDHVVLGEIETPEGRMLRVLLVFAHREIVDRYLEAFKKAKLKLASIDFEAFALLRAVCPPEGAEGADRATVALSIGQERTIFAVAEGRQCDFTRVLEWGGGSLTVALARALDMTPSQAEPIKRTLAFSGDPDHSELSAVQLESARSAARNELQVLARELLASLHFYQSRPGSLAIGEILVTGGGMELQGAADELQALLGVPVKSVDPYENVLSVKKAKISHEPGATAIAIGLGMDA